MSFAAEMRDFYTGFRATYGVAADVRDYKMRKDKVSGTYTPDDSDFHMYSPGDITSDDGVEATAIPTSDDPPTDTDTLDDDVETRDTGAGGPPRYAAGGLVTGTQKGRQPLDMTNLKPRLVVTTKRTMKAFGKDVPIVSGYRDKKRNKKAGGAKRSQHVSGNAFDFDVSGLSRSERLRFIKTMSANGFTGIGVYSNSIHGDLGGRRAWGPSHGHESIPKWAKGTIDQHLAGKFKGYSPTNDTEDYAAEEEMPSESPSQEDDGYDYDYAALDDGTDERDITEAFDRASQAVSDGYEETQQDLTAGSREAMNDTQAIEIPSGASLYRPGDLTQTPLYAAEGGTVPWKDEVSYLRRPNTALPEYRPFQTSGPLADLPDTAPDKKPPRRGIRKNNGYNGQAKLWRETSLLRGGRDGVFRTPGLSYNAGYQAGQQGGNYTNPNRGSGYNSYAEGGAVPGEEEDVTSEVTAIPTSDTPPARAASSLPPPPAGNPRGSNREALAMELTRGAGAQRRGPASTGTVIDAGLKFLTRSLGLDKAGAAVGPDPELRSAKTKLINGAIGPNEGPPTQEEVDGIYKVVDPKGELDSGLRTIYAMKKGYDFYMQRGQPEKAAKFVAGMVQYSNLLSKRFGVEAVNAGKAGDEAGMVKYAIKAYDNVPDGLKADVTKKGGNYEVTRTDEDGKVVDRHLLTPQQIFQMATGISQGSGFFEAMMESGKKAMTPYQEESLKLQRERLDLQKSKEGKPTPSEERRIKNDEQGTKYYTNLYPGIKNELSPEEKVAWEEAAAAGNPALLKDLYNDVTGRVGKRKAQELKDREVKAQKTLYPDYEAELTENEKKTVQQALVDGDTETVQRIYSRVDQKKNAEAAATRAEEKRTAGETAKQNARLKKAQILDKRYPLYEPKLKPEDRETWKAAVEAGEPEIILGIIRAIDYADGAPLSDPNDPPPEDDNPAADGALPEAVTPPANTSQSNPPLKRAPDSVLAQARAAIAKKGRDAVVGLLKENGYSDEGL